MLLSFPMIAFWTRVRQNQDDDEVERIELREQPLADELERAKPGTAYTMSGRSIFSSSEIGGTNMS